MSNEQIKKLAEDFAKNTTDNSKNNEKKEVTKMAKKFNENPTKVLEISREYVKAFYANAKPEDKNWIKGRMAQLQVEKGTVKYFAAFRAEFAKKYLPELVSDKASRKRISLLDELEALDKEGGK